MTWDEYNKLFHKLQLNLVAFKPLMQCDAEVLKLVNFAIEQEREACAKVCETEWSNVVEKMYGQECATAIRARGQP
jgi:hypothetical protein